jgi:hypothetical protein
MNIFDIFMTLLILPLNPFRERKISKSRSGMGSGYSDPPEQVEAIGHEIYSGSSPNWVAAGIRAELAQRQRAPLPFNVGYIRL